jgi:E3 ubiquitin-protein ligase HECTD2
MAPWSDRLLTPTSRPDPGQNSPGQSKTLPAQAKVPSRVTEENLLEHAYGIPTLSHGTAWSHSSKPRRTASHGRSMSHPFPSLFTGRKKAQGDSGAGFESTDEDSISPTLARNTSLNPSAKQIRVPDKDLMTGKCMTCNSMVRWPKDLKVFRCTVCLTINDLKPVFLGARSGDGHRAVKHGPQKGKFLRNIVEIGTDL